MHMDDVEMNQNLVSIVMPAYNSSRFIASSIDSVLAQTYENWELLIVDDLSTDSTREIARAYSSQDCRIRLIELRVNGGPARARNAAISAAKGRYLAFLDSDDLWLREKLALQIEFMRRGRFPFTFTSYSRISESGQVLGSYIPIKSEYAYADLLKDTGIACLTVILDRTQCDPIVMPETRHEDYALWLALLKRGLLAHGLQVDLARYRVVNNSLSNRKTRSATWVWQIYRRQEELPLLQAFWCFINYAVRGQLKRSHFFLMRKRKTWEVGD